MTGAMLDSFQRGLTGASQHFPQLDPSRQRFWGKPSWDEAFAQRWMRLAVELREMRVGL
jgi:hypothetical protein